MAKTIAEINEKIRQGKVVVYTAEEIIGVVKKKGLKQAAVEVDVVTTGTFGPMCSSGAYFNLGHTKPRIKMGGGRVTINDIPAYAASRRWTFSWAPLPWLMMTPGTKSFLGSFLTGVGMSSRIWWLARMCA